MKRFTLFLGLGILATLLGPGSRASARLSVLATTTDLAAIAREVGGELIQIEAICKGTQDPHFVEAKPSYMVKAARADLLLAVGLDLEVGYLPSILQGARNPKVKPGAAGYFEVGPLIEPLEATTGAVSRSEGDVHPLGNPHFTLDPLRVGRAAVAIAGKLGELDPGNRAKFQERAEAYQKRLAERTVAWAGRIDRSGVKKVITYHRTLNYFFERFHLSHPAELEPKPGVPPTSGHTINVIRMIREQKIPLIMVENFFDPSVTGKIKNEVPSVRVVTVPVAVDGAPGTETVESLVEKLVLAVEGK